MADTLSFGYLRPASGDPANVWQPAIEQTITQLNSHNHDGVNSATISPASITTLLSPISVAAWGAPDAGGTYTATINAPGAITEVNNFYPKTYLDSDGSIVYLSVLRTTPTQIQIQTNNNVDMTISWR